jgi:hypothetical protein
MALTNAYATVAELRGLLKDDGAKLDAPTIERALNASSRAIDDYCHRRFWVDATVQTREYQVLSPRLAHLDDISTTTGLIVKTDTGLDASWATTWTSGTDFRLEPRNADKDGPSYAWWKIVAIGAKLFPICHGPGGAWGGSQLVVYRERDTLQVTAMFGWSTIPDQVNQACLLKAVSLFKRKDAPFGVAGFGEFGVVRIGRNDPDVQGLLDPFVRWDRSGLA